jgi:hypothetical protein
MKTRRKIAEENFMEIGGAKIAEWMNDKTMDHLCCPVCYGLVFLCPVEKKYYCRECDKYYE